MSKTSYIFNLLFIVSLVIFVNFLRNNICDFQNIVPLHWLWICIVSFLLNFLKCFRLYFIFVGSKKISKSVFVQEFAKTAFVSLFLPWKFGDIYRAYCFGARAENMKLGVMSVLVDRFFDTLALVTLLFVLLSCTGSEITTLQLLFLLFLLIVIFAYILSQSLL